MPKEDDKAAKDAAVPVAGQKNKLMLIGAAGFVAVLLAVGGFMMLRHSDDSQSQVMEPLVEVSVTDNIFQLKDGSYLSLGFSIVVVKSKAQILQDILKNQTPSRLPDALNLILGNKTREDVINGSHKREALAQEIKKIIEEAVLQEYNKKQKSPQDMIEVRKILFHKYVTQAG